MHKKKNSTGLTLLELLVALTLSLCIVAMLISIYVASQKNLFMHEAVLTIADNARISNEFLSRDIRVAGLYGCVTLSAQPNSLEGTSRSLTLRHASQLSGSVLQYKESQIVVSTKPRFQPQDKIIISDCRHGEIMLIQAVTQNKNYQILSLASPLKNHYDDSVEVSVFEEKTYLLENTRRVDRRGKKIKALYVKNTKHHRTELVEGVDDMQISYDVVVDKQLVSLSADAVTDWNAVRGVKIQFLFSAINGVNLHKHWILYAALRERLGFS